MVKYFSQSYKYDDNWPTVTLAYFLRYPNPFAAHVLSCDVISRSVSPNGLLKTTRLICKTGPVPKWFPQSFVQRAESWMLEESEVDLEGRVVTCRTRNLDHVKVMQAVEDVTLRETEDGQTIQKTTASIVSNFGWGLTKKIEGYGVSKLKSNLERSRAGVAAVITALRESRQRLAMQHAHLTMGGMPESDHAWLASHSLQFSTASTLNAHATPSPSVPLNHEESSSSSRSTSPDTKQGWLRWTFSRASSLVTFRRSEPSSTSASSSQASSSQESQ